MSLGSWIELNRRGAIALAAALATGTVANGLLVPVRAADKTAAEKGQGGDDDISATEDLISEHGVLRRALIVYAELASRLQAGRRQRWVRMMGWSGWRASKRCLAFQN